MPFEKGQSGNPNGRPKGGRQKLGEAFLADLVEDWKDNGKTALAAMRADSPTEYVKVIAGLLPKEATLNVNETLTIKSAAVSELDEWLEGLNRGTVQVQGQNPLPN